MILVSDRLALDPTTGNLVTEVIQTEVPGGHEQFFPDQRSLRRIFQATFPGLRLGGGGPASQGCQCRGRPC